MLNSKVPTSRDINPNFLEFNLRRVDDSLNNQKLFLSLLHSF